MSSFPLSGHLTPPPPPPTPHMWTDGVDTYFARDIEHLEELFNEHNGSTWEQEMGSPMADDWRSKPVDDSDLEIWFYSPSDIQRDAPPGCRVKATGVMARVGPDLRQWWAVATRQEWFRVLGYGIVASSEH